MAGSRELASFYVKNYAHVCDHQPKNESEVVPIMPIEEETAFLEQLKAGNKDKARKTLGILLDRLLTEPNITFIVPHLFELLAVTFRMVAQVADFKKAGALKIKLTKELRQVDTHEKAIAWAEQMMLQYMDLIFRENSTPASEKVIQSANAYIAENYSRDISLNEIAEYVHLSPSYFSRLYKQVTKGNLVDFINSVRISQAKKLLINSSHDIDFIAFTVGFNTHNYFTTVFRRFEGMTPSEYRLVKTRNADFNRNGNL
jgi:two-component system response regulator YesN